MRTGQPLRLYANPVKPFLLLLVAAGFTLIGLLMLQDSKVHASAFDTAKAYAVIVFSGIGTVVALIMILVYVFIRRPVLQIDGQGWSYKPPLLAGAQTVEWPNIAHVAVCRQKLPRGGSMYYLVVHARDPHRLPRPRMRAFTALLPIAVGRGDVCPPQLCVSAHDAREEQAAARAHPHHVRLRNAVL